MKITTTIPKFGCKGVIYIYDLSPIEFMPLFEEISMTKSCIDKLYAEETK